MYSGRHCRAACLRKKQITDDDAAFEKLFVFAERDRVFFAVDIRHEYGMSECNTEPFPLPYRVIYDAFMASEYLTFTVNKFSLFHAGIYDRAVIAFAVLTLIVAKFPDKLCMAGIIFYEAYFLTVRFFGSGQSRLFLQYFVFLLSRQIQKAAAQGAL